jgi:adenine phosphoribosyltransferase
MGLEEKIRCIPDFPKPGILFRDITTLLLDAAAFCEVIDRLEAHYKDKKIDKVVGIESRGFIFGAPLALRLGCGFVPIRKPGKLPSETAYVEYSLEYGTDRIEIHLDAIRPGDRVLIVDDLLATGGTAAAARSLVEKLGAVFAGFAFIIELDGLGGRSKIGGAEVFTLIHF